MIKLSNILNKKLYEDAGETQAPVAQTTTHPVAQNPVAEPPKLKCIDDLKDRYEKIIKKISDKKGGKLPLSSETGVRLQKDVNIIINNDKTNEKYELNFVDFKEDDTPLYSIVTNNTNMQKQIKPYVILNDEIYQKVNFIYDGLNKWREKISISQNQVVKTPTTVNANVQNISKYSDFIKIFEIEQQQQKTKMTIENFDNNSLSQFTNSAVFGNYENFKEIAAALTGLKSINSDLYNKQYKDFIQLKDKIIPSSKKNEYITKWYLSKWNEDKHKYEIMDAGETIKNGDAITINKEVKADETPFTVKGFRVTNVQIKKQEQKLFEQLSRQDIDPYSEEDWDDDNDTPIIQIAKKQNKPLDQITHLSCSDKSLTSLEGIEHLTNLRELDCSYNQLTSLEGIEHLTNLRELYCSNNELTSLEGIENLINLRILYCSHNRLTSLEGIEHLTNLRYLYCYNNQFTNEYKNYLRTIKLKLKNLKILEF